MEKRPLLKSLQGKLTLQTLLVGLVPVAAVGVISYLSLVELTDITEERLEQSRIDLSRDVVGATLSATAGRVSQQIDVYMRERILDAMVWAKAPNVIEAVRSAAIEHDNRGLTDLSVAAVEQQFKTAKSLSLYPKTDAYLREQIALSPHFGEVFITDSNGYNVALTNPTSDFVQSDEGWWRQAWNAGLDVGDVEFDDSAGIWAIEISARIDDPVTGTRLGVMKTVLGVSLIQEVATAGAEEIISGTVTVATGEGLLLAETASNHSRERIMNPQINLRGTGNRDIMAAFGDRERGYELGEERVLGYAHLSGGESYRDLLSGFDGFDWVVVVEQPTAIAFAPIQGLVSVQRDLEASKTFIFFVLVIAVLLVAVISIIAANVLSRRITKPLLMLRTLADNVSKGDTSKTIVVTSDDEINDLAAAFERMRKSISIAMRRMRDARTTSVPARISR